jgi:transcriptional regulator with XRE-family HTH domain
MSDIKAFRLAHGYSLRIMSEMLGLSKSMISMIENEHRDMPAKTARLFSEIQQNHPENRSLSFPLPIYQHTRARHDGIAEEYLKIYRGDCQAEHHKISKLLNALKKRYNACIEQRDHAIKGGRTGAAVAQY